jgi:uncharacterized membrane protein
VARALRRHAPRVVLVVVVLAYALAAGGLALRRHANLDSQALDMGYADQVTWNALHGRGLRFTVFRGPVGAEAGQPLPFGTDADRDSLFAYHVELLFFLIAPLYLVHSGPETLIVVLTGVIALGAVAAYGVAGRVLQHRGAALGFAVLYLLFPSLQAANLADFHGVSLTASLLLFAFWFLIEGRTWAFAAAAVLSVATKEQVGFTVAGLGIYAWAGLGRRWLGLTTVTLAVGWTALCFAVILPRANGGAPSLFARRYGEALQQLTAFPSSVAAGAPTLPVPSYVFEYTWHLLLGSGLLSLAAPLHLGLAAPAVAANALSSSPWQHSGGAHYSAEAVPAFVLASIYGARRLATLACRLGQRCGIGLAPGQAALPLSLLALAVAGCEHWHQGILPPAARVPRSGPSAHAARVRPLLALIPPDARISAQSNLFPQLSRRQRIYVFPAVEDADYVLLDVYGTSDPLQPDELFVEAQRLLQDPLFGVVAADDGVVLLKRGWRGSGGSGGSGGRLGAPTTVTPPPDSFLTFAEPERLPPGRNADQPLASFGDLFDVVGARFEPLPEVSFFQRRAIPVIHLRARRAPDDNYRFAPFVVGHTGLARNADEGNAVQLWHPTTAWVPGTVYRVRYPPLAYRPGRRFGLGVQIGRTEATVRLRAASSSVPLLDGDYVVDLGPLP